MSWLFPNPRLHSPELKERFATETEIRHVFEAEHETLHWISLLITGDAVKAERAVLDAAGLQKTMNGVFRDWLGQWAHAATTRTAAASVRELMARSVQKYGNFSCDDIDHELLSDEQIEVLREIEPNEIIAQLDPLARAVFVIRGVERTSIFDCSQMLGVSRQTVGRAYCHALTWFYEKTRGAVEFIPRYEVADRGAQEFSN